MHDATHNQRAQLNTRITPLIEKMRDDDPGVWKPAAKGVFTEIREVMGPDWRPSGDWKKQIDLLLKDKDE
jgi:putative component of toxin-antitoxin plasmid stabilization module